MNARIRKSLHFIFTLSFFLMTSGCIRLTSQAGYFKKTPKEQTERVVGFDTAKVFKDQQTKGSVTA